MIKNIKRITYNTYWLRFRLHFSFSSLLFLFKSWIRVQLFQLLCKSLARQRFSLFFDIKPKKNRKRFNHFLLLFWRRRRRREAAAKESRAEEWLKFWLNINRRPMKNKCQVQQKYIWKATREKKSFEWIVTKRRRQKKPNF